ncbi:hypothetical protein F6P94_10165 [Escherichia coli]|nr:hypothetical protein F6P94_10165 [Escherichia coli]
MMMRTRHPVQLVAVWMPVWHAFFIDMIDIVCLFMFAYYRQSHEADDLQYRSLGSYCVRPRQIR